MTRIRKIRHPEDDSQESYLLRTVRNAAIALGWRVYHTHDSRKSEEGFPDLVLTRRTRLVFAELKSPTGKTTPAQDAWMDALRQTGQEVYLWRLADWDSGAIAEVLK
jgi:hypothetical protein